MNCTHDNEFRNGLLDLRLKRHLYVRIAPRRFEKMFVCCRLELNEPNSIIACYLDRR
jgi:hypothetical protein